ncbi:hypothetical protein [Streptomyces sp. SID8352]|uniref:hypothetical protein n=1 Tax=Streptomyces sp. SID8352 TaxID=2690338 RepID=UPI0019292FEF|nr:hypothetical protein [Streptomyces sp. SID8352]
MSLPRQQSTASPSTAQHTRMEEIDAAIITLVRERLTAMTELEDQRRNGRAPRTELARENAVFRRYETELGPLGTRLAMLLTSTKAPGAAASGTPHDTSAG